MKKIILLALLLVSVSDQAIASFDSPLGSPGNPIYFEEVKTYQQKQQEMINRYGSSEFYSCMNQTNACSGDISDPRNQDSCLTSVQYNFSRGACGRTQITPTVQCSSGYTQINGVCVQDQTTSPYVTCSTGYWWTPNGCAPMDMSTLTPLVENDNNTQTENSEIDNNVTCRSSYGQQSYWNGKFNNDGSIECDCVSGYEFNDANQCVYIKVAPSNEILPDNNITIANPINVSESRKPRSVSVMPAKNDFNSVIKINPVKGTLLGQASFRSCPATSCSVIRFYAETSLIDIDAKSSDDKWYRINGTSDAGGTGYKVVGWISGSLIKLNGEVIVSENIETKIETVQSDDVIEPTQELQPEVGDKNLGLFGKIKQFFMSFFK